MERLTNVGSYFIVALWLLASWVLLGLAIHWVLT